VEEILALHKNLGAAGRASRCLSVWRGVPQPFLLADRRPSGARQKKDD